LEGWKKGREGEKKGGTLFLHDLALHFLYILIGWKD
jgi:hypothetical protein